MRGNLPVPVATMLERKHGCFDAEKCDIHVVSEWDDLEGVVPLSRTETIPCKGYRILGQVDLLKTYG